MGAGITKFAPNMDHKILPPGIENGSHWPWLDLQGHLGHFDSEFLEIQLVRTVTCILGFSRLVFENRSHWPWPSWSFGHLDSQFLKLISAWGLYIDLGIPTCSCLFKSLLADSSYLTQLLIGWLAAYLSEVMLENGWWLFMLILKLRRLTWTWNLISSSEFTLISCNCDLNNS